jgi:mono/diheme cytochrome c family protein
VKFYHWVTLGIPMLCLPLLVGCGQSTVNLQQDEQHGFSAAVQLYQTNCVSCHGDGLEGDIGPSLTHVASSLTEAEIEHQIYYGGGPMPGYGSKDQAILSDQDIHTLAVWLHTKK